MKDKDKELEKVEDELAELMVENSISLEKGDYIMNVVEKYCVLREQRAKQEVFNDFEKLFNNLWCIGNYDKYKRLYQKLKKKQLKTESFQKSENISDNLEESK